MSWVASDIHIQKQAGWPGEAEQRKAMGGWGRGRGILPYLILVPNKDAILKQQSTRGQTPVEQNEKSKKIDLGKYITTVPSQISGERTDL